MKKKSTKKRAYGEKKERMHGVNFMITEIVKKVVWIGRMANMWKAGFRGAEGGERREMWSGWKDLEEVVWGREPIQKIDRRMKKMKGKMARMERDRSVKNEEGKKVRKRL